MTMFKASDLAKRLSTGSAADEFRFTFGIETKKVAEKLRWLADAIEADKEVMLLAKDDGPKTIVADGEEIPAGQWRPWVEVEAVEVSAEARRDDFTYSKITITLAERVRA